MMTSLEPLSADQVSTYIQHRLNVAECRAGSLFTRDALADIADKSAGIPRVINILCYNALALGFARQQKCIDLGIVRQATNDLALEQVAHNGKQIAHNNAADRGKFTHSDQNDRVQKVNNTIVGSTARERTNSYRAVNRIWTRFSTLAKGSIGLAVLLITIPISTTPNLRQPARQTSPKPRVEWKADSLSLLPGENTSAVGQAHSDYAAILTDIRYWSEPTATKVVIDVDERVKYDAYRLAAPDRIYLDLHGKLSAVLFSKQFQVQDALLRKIRIAKHADEMTRITLETSKPCEYSIAFISNPTRLSITLWSPGRHAD